MVTAVQLADRISNIYKFVPKLRTVRNKYFSVIQESIPPTLNLTPDTVIFLLVRADPSKRKIYCEWMLNLFISGDLLIPEDLKFTSDILKKFHKIKNTLSDADRDINNYLSKGRLYHFVYSITPPSPLLTEEIQEKKLKEIDSEIEIVYTGPEGWIRIPKTEKASQYLGKGTTWCTAYTETRCYFNDYNIVGPLYVVYNRKTKSLYQYHAEQGGLKNKIDENVKYEEFIEADLSWSLDVLTNYPSFNINKFFALSSTKKYFLHYLITKNKDKELVSLVKENDTTILKMLMEVKPENKDELFAKVIKSTTPSTALLPSSLQEKIYYCISTFVKSPSSKKYLPDIHTKTIFDVMHDKKTPARLIISFLNKINYNELILLLDYGGETKEYVEELFIENHKRSLQFNIKLHNLANPEKSYNVIVTNKVKDALQAMVKDLTKDPIFDHKHSLVLVRKLLNDINDRDLKSELLNLLPLLYDDELKMRKLRK